MLNRQVILDERCRTLLHLDEDETPTYTSTLRNVHPADKDVIKETVLQTVLKQSDHHFSIRFRCITEHNNILLWLHIKGQTYFDKAGNAIRISGIAQDITSEIAANEKAAEKDRMLKEAEQRFSLVFDNATIGMASVDNQGIFTMVNRAYAGLLGYTPAELVGRQYTSIIHEDHQKENDRLFKELLQGKRDVFNQIKRYHQKHGAGKWVQVNVARINNEDDRTENIFIIAFDISNEVAVRKEQQTLLSLVENSSDFISVANIAGNITYVNDAGIKLMGFGNKGPAGKRNLRKLFPPEQLSQWENDILPALMSTGKWTGRQDFIHLSTGELLPFHINAFRLDSPMSGKPIALACVARDLKGELETQQALQNSEARFRSLIEEAPVATALFVGRNLVIEVANEPMIEFWGKGKAVLGQPLGVAVPELNDQPFLKILDDVFTSGIAYSEKEAKAILVMNDIPETFYFNYTYKPLLNADGEVYAIMDMAINVTQQVLARNQILENQGSLEQEVVERTEELAASNEELAAMNEELQDANMNLVRTNQELEQYAYVASHDLQEPLRKIRIYADLLSNQQDLPPHHEKLVEKINQSSERMSMLIKDLLEFSRLLEKGNMMQEVDLTSILQSVISDFELIIEEKKASIIIGPLPNIQAIPLQINQLFYNLMSNALKFTQPGTIPVISIQSELLTVDVAGTYLGKPERHKKYYDISFSDNGIGFEQKYADQIFEVFKRLHTRALYPGSGIGLSLCRRIVVNHAGHLYVTSTPGKGTSFHIILPET
jgi:PAS domain S-box-containing protein